MRGVLRLVAIAFVLVVILRNGLAEAHAIGVSRGVYRVAPGGVHAELVLARGELAALAPSVDAEGLRATILDGVRVTAETAPCAGLLDGVRAAAEDGVAIDVTYTCPQARHVTVHVPLLDKLTHGHRHIARIEAGDVRDVLLFRGATTFSAEASVEAKPTFLGFVRMGVEHILTGYDHLVFLFALVLVGGRVRSILAVVSAFTLAHSITLAIAALGLWSPPPSIVEPAIALSIAYVGMENFVLRRPERRWRLTFAFGLVHGFGFAGALREIALPRGEMASALVGFNAGVELGQVGVLAMALPVLGLLRRSGAISDGAVKALNAAVAAAGVLWFLARVA